MRGGNTLFVSLILLSSSVKRLFTSSFQSALLRRSRSFHHHSAVMATKRKLEGEGGGTSKAKAKSSKSNDEPELSFTPAPFCPSGILDTRTRILSEAQELKEGGECVVLWMSRDQRLYDNHAVTFAQRLAKEKGLKFKIVFNLVPKFLEATIRQFGFMLKGIEEVERQSRSRNIPFFLLSGNPVMNVANFAKSNNAACVVADFSPLRVPLSWVMGVKDEISDANIPLVQVDAHNIVPCWVTSPKLEYSARTIRSKIESKLPTYLEKSFPEVADGDIRDLEGCPPVDWNAAYASLQIDQTVPEVNWLQPGPTAGLKMLETFVNERLKTFDTSRNDPNVQTASNLSPYFHFGQVGVQRAIIRVKAEQRHSDSTKSFVEEAIIRRELSDNFCFYNPNYDSLVGCYEWAQTTLKVHSTDQRTYIYTQQQLERAETHDDLWNAAQLQMVIEGKMHGFLRMYWAKKILEWTPTPEEALRIAIYLNDRFELDGRDPNGYVGCMWSIGGIHDQGWGERPIFGKIRFMNYDGCKRKFNVAEFVSRYPQAAKNAVDAGGTPASASGGKGKGKAKSKK